MVATADPPRLHAPQEMTLTEHLAELRRRVLMSVAGLLSGGLAGFMLAEPIIQWLKTLAPPAVHFVQLGPGEVLMAACRVSLAVGISLGLPVLLYQGLRFAFPGLSRQERVWLLGVVVAGMGLFALGAVFATWAVVPPTLSWLLTFGQEIADLQMSVGRYVEFCLALLVMTGVMFELPLVLAVLALMGWVSSAQLAGQWRVAVVGIFIVSAILTPSQDPLSMTAVGVAMVLLYGVSVLGIRLMGR